MNTERIKETRSVVEDDLVVGPQGFDWIVEDVNGNQITIRRFGTRENTRTITEAHLEGDGGFRPKNKQKGETRFNKDQIKQSVREELNSTESEELSKEDIREVKRKVNTLKRRARSGFAETHSVGETAREVYDILDRYEDTGSFTPQEVSKIKDALGEFEHVANLGDPATEAFLSLEAFVHDQQGRP